MSVSYKSPLQRLIESGEQFSRKQTFELGRDACVEYARKAYANRGDPILLLLADDMAEIEAPPIVAGRSGSQHRADLELLAKVRAHPMRDGAVRAMRKAISSVEQDVRFDPECDKDKAMGLIHVWFEMIALLSPPSDGKEPSNG